MPSLSVVTRSWGSRGSAIVVSLAVNNSRSLEFVRPVSHGVRFRARHGELILGGSGRGVNEGVGHPRGFGIHSNRLALYPTCPLVLGRLVTEEGRPHSTNRPGTSRLSTLSLRDPEGL